MMELTFWGVRGSIPAPGPGTVRYGGNTSCVSLRTSEGKLIVLDCGTGARNLGMSLLDGPFGRGKGQASILLSHAQVSITGMTDRCRQTSNGRAR